MSDILSMIQQGDVEKAKRALETELAEHGENGDNTASERDHWPEIVAACALPRDKTKEAGEIVEIIASVGEYPRTELPMSAIIENDHASIVDVFGPGVFAPSATMWAELCLQKRAWKVVLYMIKHDVVSVSFRSNAFMSAAVEERNLDVIMELVRCGGEWRLTGVENLFGDGVLVANNREKFACLGKEMNSSDDNYDELLSEPITSLTVAQLCYIIRREINAELRARRIMLASDPNIPQMIFELISEKKKEKNN